MQDMQQPSPNRYWAQIARVPFIGKDSRPLYRYVIRSVGSGQVVCEGHAGDPEDAESTARAHINYLLQREAAIQNAA